MVLLFEVRLLQRLACIILELNIKLLHFGVLEVVGCDVALLLQDLSNLRGVLFRMLAYISALVQSFDFFTTYFGSIINV